MPLRFTLRLRIAAAALLAVAGVLALLAAYAPRPATQTAHAAPFNKPFCATNAALCTETVDPWNYAGQYTGHDEPSLLFYSNTAGAGNSNLYQLTLPKDPPTPPAQDGTGGTWNFQLHPAFWFGMAMCDDQSAPNVGGSSVGAQKLCTPDSDTNIFTGTTPGAPDYLGLTPGTGFMEMQFYPPGIAAKPFGVSCGNTQWCAAMTIDSDSENENTGVLNNAACLNTAGQEYVNFALITKSGQSQGPADPLRQTAATFAAGPDTLVMNSGDQLSVNMRDTTDGFRIDIADHTTGQSGSMTASIANGFGHPLFQPNASACGDQAYAFHPIYSTSSPSTRVLWAAHSYNVAFSDEIGHFEYCNQINVGHATCASKGVTDPGGKDGDDNGCVKLPVGGTTVTLSGCTDQDVDFDGPEYFNNWPGTLKNATTDAALHAAPIRFTSPLFTKASGGALTNYDRVAFETNLPRIEFATTPACQRHVSNPSDPSPGSGCVNPAPGTSFYPFFSTGTSGGQCVWQEGGNFIPGTTNSFGGTSAAEYGNLQDQLYPRTGPGVQGIFETFHNTLSSNPCPA